MSSMIPSSFQYDALTKGSRALTGFSSRYILGKGWKLITKKDPPKNPAHPGVLWGEALAWGALTGMAAGILGVVARRLAAEWWRQNQGAIPGESDG